VRRSFNNGKKTERGWSNGGDVDTGNKLMLVSIKFFICFFKVSFQLVQRKLGNQNMLKLFGIVGRFWDGNTQMCRQIF
jgi:hypothetical protein